MRVAAIQFAPEFKKPKENLTRLAHLMQRSVAQGARLIVLPELATTGYSFMNPEDAAPFAEVIAEPQRPLQAHLSMHVMRLLTRQWHVSVVWGLVEKDPLTGKLYNSQVYMDPTGFFQSYRKVNRWGNDYLWASEGEKRPPVVRTVIDGKQWKIGLLICRDVRDKKEDDGESFYEKGDADIVCFSANWGDGGFPATTWMDFVKSNGTYFVVANRYGKELPNNFGEGGACIISPNGRVHCEGLVWNQDCIVSQDIP